MKRKLAIISNDAGGSELISSWLKHGDYNFDLSLRGPAIKIFKNYFGDFINLSLKEAIDNSDLVITGSGWASNHEFDAIDYAKKNSKMVITFLDHWVNYEQRFIRNGVKVFPDEFWVSDEYAYKIAQKIFPELKVKLIQNYYIKDLLSEIRPIDRVKNNNLLYVLEPMRNKWGKHKLGEFQALDYFVRVLPKLKLPENIKIKLRPHPSEKKNKYNNWISKNIKNYNISYDFEKYLANSISKSKWVVGCESFALAISVYAKRKVFSSLPPGSHDCRIPLNEIVKIKNFYK